MACNGIGITISIADPSVKELNASLLSMFTTHDMTFIIECNKCVFLMGFLSFTNFPRGCNIEQLLLNFLKTKSLINM